MSAKTLNNTACLEKRCFKSHKHIKLEEEEKNNWMIFLPPLELTAAAFSRIPFKERYLLGFLFKIGP